VAVYIHVFLNSELIGGEWPASHPGRFTLVIRSTGAYWIGGWVDPRAGLNKVERRKILPLAGLELGRPACNKEAGV
jgi:hypothetical protein